MLQEFKSELMIARSLFGEDKNKVSEAIQPIREKIAHCHKQIQTQFYFNISSTSSARIAIDLLVFP